MTLPGTSPAEMIPRIVDLIGSGRTFVLAAHENADGDALGAEIALRHALVALGREAHIVNMEPPMRRYRFLGADLVEVFDAATAPALLERADAVFVVDNNSWPRLGRLGPLLRGAAAPVVCIDHHIAETPFSPFHLIDTSAAATTEIVLALVDALGVPLTREIATAIYTGLCTDTGWFRYSNTTPRTFRMAARLLEAGVDPELVNAEVHYQDTRPRQRLLARMLERVELESAVFAHSFVSLEMMRDLEVTWADTDDFIEFIRGLAGVKIALLLKEHERGVIKASLRSRDAFSANAVARKFGGGGHRHASGLTFRGTLEEARRALAAEVRLQIPAGTPVP